jgi:hypothetical protein
MSQPNGSASPAAGSKGQPDPGPAGQPLLRIVAGHPGPEEIAAVTAALSALAAASEAAARRPRAGNAWSDRARLLGVPPAHGPDAWRRSAWPG